MKALVGLLATLIVGSNLAFAADTSLDVGQSIDAATKASVLLATFGFIGLGAVLIIIGAVSVPVNKWIAASIIAAGIASCVWGLVFPVKSVTVSGIVEDVPKATEVIVASELVVGACPARAYTRRDPTSTRSDVEFVLMTAGRAQTLNVILSPQDPASAAYEEEAPAFKIPLLPDDYNERKTFRVYIKQSGERAAVDFTRVTTDGHPDKVSSAEASDPPSAGCLPKLPKSAGSSTAANPPSAEEYRQRFLSDDALIRRGSRVDLAKTGTASFDVISKFLSSGEYRLELGAAVTIADLNQPVDPNVKADFQRKLAAVLAKPEGQSRVLQGAIHDAQQKLQKL